MNARGHAGPSDPLPRRFSGGMLRRLAPGDLAAFQAYRSDPGLARFQGWTSTSDAEALAFLTAMQGAALFVPGTWVQVAIAGDDGQALAGDIGLCLSDDGCGVEIGFTLSRPAQGRGLATAAVGAAMALVFDCTAADRVVGITDARNHASIRVLERAGMTRAESLHVVFRGEPCLEFVYVRARPR